MVKKKWSIYNLILIFCGVGIALLIIIYPLGLIHLFNTFVEKYEDTFIEIILTACLVSFFLALFTMGMIFEIRELLLSSLNLNTKSGFKKKIDRILSAKKEESFWGKLWWIEEKLTELIFNRWVFFGGLTLLGLLGLVGKLL